MRVHPSKTQKHERHAKTRSKTNKYGVDLIGGQTPVVRCGRIHLLKRAIACKMVERAGFIVRFAQ